MTEKAPTFPIRRKLQAIVFGLIILLAALQLFVQSFFMGAMRMLYMANANATIDQVAGTLHELLSQQENAVAHIANEPDVSVYAATRDVRIRYQMAFGIVQPIVRSAVQNLPIDHVIIYDTSDAWYQFIGAVDYQTFHTVRNAFADLKDNRSVSLVIGGALYLCSAEPLLSMDGSQVRRDGLVVAMLDAKTIRDALPDSERLLGGAVMLHDGRSILLSNSPALEGMPLSEAPISEGSFFVSSNSILPSLEVTVSIPRDQIFPQQTPYLLAFLVVALFSLLALSVTLSLSSRWFSRPISQVLSGMSGINVEGKRLTRTNVAHIDALVGGINDLLDRQEESNRQMIQAQQTLYETELEHQQTQLILLKKQINAHFLYNCLTCIKSLTEEGESEKAGEMAQSVAMLMRYTHGVQENVNIFDEMGIIQRYVQIMNLRFGDRFHYTFDVDDELMGYTIPRLLLQPLVENAMVHGLERQNTACHLEIGGKLDEGAIVFTIKDNGVGIPPERLRAIHTLLAGVDINYPYMQLKGISLVNIEKRVHAAYGPEYGLTVESEEGRFTRVTLRIRAVPDTAL